MVDEVVWVKMTVHQRLAKSHGYYLQHAKEVRNSTRNPRSPSTSQSPSAVGADGTRHTSCREAEASHRECQ